MYYLFYRIKVITPFQVFSFILWVFIIFVFKPEIKNTIYEVIPYFTIAFITAFIISYIISFLLKKILNYFSLHFKFIHQPIIYYISIPTYVISYYADPIYRYATIFCTMPKYMISFSQAKQYSQYEKSFFQINHHAKKRLEILEITGNALGEEKKDWGISHAIQEHVRNQKAILATEESNMIEFRNKIEIVVFPGTSTLFPQEYKDLFPIRDVYNSVNLKLVTNIKLVTRNIRIRRVARNIVENS